MQKTAEKFATIRVQHDIDEEHVKDMLCSAWEGGSNYWCALKDRKFTKEAKAAIRKLTTPLYGHEYPFIPGVQVILTDASGEGEDCGHPEPWVLTRQKLLDGLQVMADKYPQHFANFINENDDAETGDVYLQVCLFGEIVFG